MRCKNINRSASSAVALFLTSSSKPKMQPKSICSQSGKRPLEEPTDEVSEVSLQKVVTMVENDSKITEIIRNKYN